MRLVRLGRLALLGILAAIGAAFVFSILLDQRQDEPPSATVTLGLTGEVNWPFFEPVRGRLALLADDDLRSAVADQLGHDDLRIEVVVPETLAVIEITATANTHDVAVAGADLAASMVLDRAGGDRLAGIDAKIDAAGATLDELEQELEVAEAGIITTVAELDAADTAEDSASRMLLDRDLHAITETRNSRLRSVLQIESDLSRLQIDRESSAAEVDVVNRTSSDPMAESQPLLPIGFGLFVGIVVAAGAFWIQTEHGRVVSPTQVEEALGLPVLNWPAPGNEGALRWFYQVRSAGTDFLFVEGPAQARASFLDACDREDLSAADQRPLLVDPSAATGDPRILHVDSAIVIIQAATTVRQLRRQVAELSRSAITVLAFVQPDENE